jgi:hypothetical protein
MSISPVLLFVYNRPNHLRRTVEALKANNLAGKSDLFIFSDNAKHEKAAPLVEEVRMYIRTISGFNSIKIIERNKNYGLANSIISGVTEVIKKYKKVIVLEDDLISSSNFLDFANQCLDKYEENKKIFSIASYTYNLKFSDDYAFDNYFTPRCESLGWGTWLDRWGKADWEVNDFNSFLNDKNKQKEFNTGGADLTEMLIKQMAGKIDSWAVRWCYTHFKNNAFCSYPTISKIVHIGDDKHGTNVKGNSDLLNTPIDESNKIDFTLLEDLSIEPKIMEQYKQIFKRSVLKKIKHKLLQILNK